MSHKGLISAICTIVYYLTKLPFNGFHIELNLGKEATTNVFIKTILDSLNKRLEIKVRDFLGKDQYHLVNGFLQPSQTIDYLELFSTC